MIDTAFYVKDVRFVMGGREFPFLDCWGLYRLLVGTMAGKWLGEYEGVESNLAIARVFSKEKQSDEWLGVEPGTEKELDLVLMHGFVGRGRETRTHPLHVGCVVKLGWMLDCEETNGVLYRPFRTTSTKQAHPTVVSRVLGIYRPKVLA